MSSQMFQLDEEAAQEVEAKAEKAEKEVKAQADEAARLAADKQAEEAEYEAMKQFSDNKLMVIENQLPVQGCQLVPSKIIGIIAKIRELLEPHAEAELCAILYTTNFLEDEGRALTGAYSMLTESMSVSLSQVFEDCTAEECIGRMSMIDQVWATLIRMTAHEMCHTATGDEAKTDALALDILTTIAQQYDMETPALIDMGWLGHKLEQWYQSIESKEEDAYKLQRQMRNEDIVYMFESNKRIGTLRQWFRLMNNDRKLEDAWDIDVPVSVTQTAAPDALATISPVVEAVMPEMVMPEVAAPVITEPVAEIITGLPADAADLSSAMAAYASDLSAGVIEPTGAPVQAASGVVTPSDATIAMTAYSAESLKPWEKPSSIAPTAVSCSPDELRVARRNILVTAFQLMFCHCGWDYNGSFTDPDYVARTEVGISGIPHGNEALVGLDTVINGKKCYDVPAAGILRGFVGARAKLPQFSVHLNDGAAVTRYSVMPQNPATASETAKLAAAGQMIAWVTCGNKWVAKITCPTGQPADPNNVVIELL